VILIIVIHPTVEDLSWCVVI